MRLDGSDAHKIVNVLRKRDGDEIEVIDSAAQRFAATLAIDGRTVRATLGALKTADESAFPEITVAQGVPKGQKMDFVVEKLTELGAARIIPLQSERTIASEVNTNKIERWRRLAKTAAQQCGRARITEIAGPQTLAALIEQFGTYDAVLFLWELADRTPLRERLPQLAAKANTVLVIIGPEGGFSHTEADAAASAGAALVSLGERVLRTETAGLVMLALLNYVAGG